VGRSFREGPESKIKFIRADLESMKEASRVGTELAAAAPWDVVVLTTGIISAPTREATAEGIERDLAVSYLSRLAILDETDSGLDIDALRIVAGGVNALAAPGRAIVMSTHYQRLLNYIVPDHVHVMADGRILKSGDRSLALELEERGYDWVTGARQAATREPAA
jgi:hypothetical protein